MFDNHDFYLADERQREKWLKSRPLCVACGQPIQEDIYFDLDGGKHCEECAERWLRNQRRYIWND
jgi:hypothetical protein